MAQEINEGTAYLMALSRSVQQTSAAGAAPASEAASTAQAEIVPGAPTDGDTFKEAEKRRSPRYKCEGSAEVREDGCDVHTWATFTDVSLHGCYVEAQATYPAGTVLHMKLEVDASG